MVTPIVTDSPSVPLDKPLTWINLAFPQAVDTTDQVSPSNEKEVPGFGTTITPEAILRYAFLEVISANGSAPKNTPKLLGRFKLILKGFPNGDLIIPDSIRSPIY
jgi:hypothetical protein